MTETHSIRVLYVDQPDEGARYVKRLLESLEQFSFKVELATSLRQALDFLQQRDFDVAIVNLDLPASESIVHDGSPFLETAVSDALKAFDELRAFDARLPIVMLSDCEDERVAMQAIESGAQDFLARDHITGRTLIRSLRFAIARQRKVLGLQADAETDPLTKLPNRRNLSQRFMSLLSRSVYQGQPMSLALFDLDHFKSINDRHGHFVGDVVLRTVGEVMALEVKSPMEVTRFGGEEFAMLMPGLDLDAAKQKVNHTLHSLAAKPVVVSDLSISITASSGIVDVMSSDTWQTAYVACDKLLLEAKTNGRNRYRWDCRLPKQYSGS